MEKDKKIPRRKFLKLAGGVVGLGVAACGGTAYFGTRTPAHVVFPSDSCDVSDGKKILVTYASRSGATGEISAEIMKVLCDAGYNVDLQHVNDVDSVDQYQAVVVGSPVYMGSVMGDCVSFIEKNMDALHAIPTAFFGVGLTMKEDTPENRAKMAEFFVPTVDGLQPDHVEYFAGRIKLENLPFLYRMFAQADSDGKLAEGDYRDWAAIQAWSTDLAGDLI